MKFLFDNIYKDKSVFITGHTGFKGSWLSLWLTKLGSQVTGYARKPDTIPDHFSKLDLHINSLIGDLLDFNKLADSMKQAMPQIVFHLAAQPLVRESYKYPQETYSTNVLGTLNVLEAARNTPSVQAVVVVTTDKVYENFGIIDAIVKVNGWVVMTRIAHQKPVQKFYALPTGIHSGIWKNMVKTTMYFCPLSVPEM